MANSNTHHKTIVISDVHLGSRWSKAKEATQFLTKNTCDTLILCGDIIDGWLLMRGRKKKWNTVHTDFFRRVAEIAEETKVYYIRGNHDDFLERIVPFKLHNVSIVRDFIYESCNRKYFVFHGDILDKVSGSHKWLAKLGDIGYNGLMRLNKPINKYRKRKGLPYYSISAATKRRAKESVSNMVGFEQGIKDIVKENDCTGVIYGHTHYPKITQIDDILSLNSGDWVESMSALTEDFNGNWELKIETPTF